MGKVWDRIDDELIEWIGRQHVFFVATAPAEGGHVNVSPKGYDTLRVLDGHTVAYLDLTGSGAETVAHIRQNGRITIMFCAFEGPPRVLRLFGTGTAVELGTPGYEALVGRFPEVPGARAIVSIAVERVQTSCGYSIPFMDHRAERSTLVEWAERRGPDGLDRYWSERNSVSIDGLPAIDR